MKQDPKEKVPVRLRVPGGIKTLCCQRPERHRNIQKNWDYIYRPVAVAIEIGWLYSHPIYYLVTYEVYRL